MNFFWAFRRFRIFFGPVLMLTAATLHAATNVWIKPSSGNWEETNSWSLGVLPDSSQSVRITGSWLNVAIQPTTRQSFPQSLNVHDITLAGDATTLMLNYSGTNVPLRVSNGLTIFGEGPTNRNWLIELESGLIVESGGIFVTNGQIIQSGGFIRATNGSTLLNGEYYLTNGVFEAASLQFGFGPNGYTGAKGLFYQYGGSVNLTNLEIGSTSYGSAYTIYDGELKVSGGISLGDIESSYFYQYGGRVVASELGIGSHFGGNEYRLYNGELIITNSLRIGGDYGNNLFLQAGGTNHARELLLTPVNSATVYRLNAGMLCTSNTILESGYLSPVFAQNGGTHIVTNTLSLLGHADRYGTDSAEYHLTNSYLSANKIELQASIFQQLNSTTRVSGTFQLGRDEDSRMGKLFLQSGILGCSNVTYVLAGADIYQDGGDFIVTNSFSFGGRANSIGNAFAKYWFSGGTLTASNFELNAEMTIGSSLQPYRITNPGFFKMAGTLHVGDATEQLGRFILASNAVIDLGNGVANLSFADSSGQTWNSGALLWITNWNGAANGGGNEQLKFGVDHFGLSAAQVGSIRFINPAGFSTGIYSARIVNTGEIVPSPRPLVSFLRSGNNLVLTWTNGFFLQTSTNLTGPYENINATSPYTNIMVGPQRYFRLQQ